ncbi:MAG: hypothetical protein IKK21_11205 [Clostridia bacterium]|nr:hypothetical protein [Clostridia bacterium]
MKQRMILPGAAAQTASVVLALLLTLCVLLTGVTAGLQLFTGTDGMHARVALDPGVREAQMARITERVNALSAKHGFAPETALNLITPEAMDAYNIGMIGWWQGLLQTDPVLVAPAWPSAALEEAITADEGFRAAHEERQYKSAARSAAGDVATAVQEAVLPIRASLISFAFSKVLGKIDLAKYMVLVPYLPVVTALADALLFAVIMLLCARRPVRGLVYVGSGLCAGGLSLGCVILAVAGIGLPERISTLSVLLGQQVALALRQMGMMLGGGAAVCVIAGLAMIFVHQRVMMRLRARLDAMEAQA